VKTHQWTFLTYHGRVLVYIAKHPQATCREIAREVDITERAVQKIIYDLVAEGYAVRHKIGRSNTYTVHPELPMRHHLEQEHSVGAILDALD
jgi:DNA-binding IclR family transcriptional regulator